MQHWNEKLKSSGLEVLSKVKMDFCKSSFH